MLCAAAAAGFGASAARATTTLCAEQTASVGGGIYVVQNNEYDSSASECVTTSGGADFTVANSRDQQLHQRLARFLPLHLPRLPLRAVQFGWPVIRAGAGVRADGGEGNLVVVHYAAGVRGI
jgi:hypothetical protein